MAITAPAVFLYSVVSQVVALFAVPKGHHANWISTLALCRVGINLQAQLEAMPLFGCYCSSLVAILQMRCHIAVPIWPSASLKYSVIFSQHGPRATKNKCQWPLEGTVSVGVACREHCQPVSYQLRRSLIAIGCGPFASLIVIDAQYSIIPLCAHCVHSDQLSPH